MEKLILEPTPLTCGQAVLAMLCGKSVWQVIKELDNDRETTFAQMKSYLENHGIFLGGDRVAVNRKEELPPLALLSLQTPKCWHWSLFESGRFWDPEYGILTEFPESDRRYYWELQKSVC